MKTKNTFKSLALLGAFILAMVLLFLGSPPAFGQSAATVSFINGYNLATPAISGSTVTNFYGWTNTFAAGYTVTNAATYQTNGSTIYTNYNGASGINPTLHTNANGIADVTLWANRDGTTPLANIAVDVVGPATFTNIIGTFRFAVVPTASESSDFTGVTFQPANNAQNLWAFSLTANGASHVVVSTNVPTSWLQGNRKVRLSSIEWTAGPTNGTVVGVWFNGFKPE